MGEYRRTGLAVCCSVLAVLGAAAPQALAQEPDGQGSDRFVTFVARECPDYVDITANRARNDIQESLKDLGANTAYGQGDEIDPAVEAANQPACTPITGWSFTLGTGIQTRAVSGPWGSLSIVTNPFATSIVTQPQVPLRDYAGRPTDTTIDGAVTVELSAEEAARAAQGNSLWVQGGTPTDPILDQQFPDEYGFGALRCAIDDLNGDNVEWIAYPAGTNHVFCYAYYVKPPPTSGTITIRKEVEGVPGADETFGFDGNISFNTGNVFTLGVRNGKPASQKFYRAAGATPWTARELVPAGWRLSKLECQKTGGSAITTDRAGAEVSIVLAAGDNVTCTFTNALRPITGQLFIRKVTRGGVGRFGFDISPADGTGKSAHAVARTTEEGVAAEAEPNSIELPPGTYHVDEGLPQSRRGEWRLASATCDGQETKPNEHGVDVTLTARSGASCTFENQFVPAGGIVVTKQTLGGVGTAGFVISPVADPTTIYSQSATTREPGVPVVADGDRTRHIALGEYAIQETAPAESNETWELTYVICNGKIVPATEGRVIVKLTQADPRMLCAFANTRVPGSEPPVDPPGPDHVPGGAEPDLTIVKLADRGQAVVGERVTYRVHVRNRGPVAAEHVIVADQPGIGERLVSVRRGECEGRRLILCRIPYLASGASTTFELVMQITAAAGATVTNRAVVGSASSEQTVRNNGDVAAVRARRDRCGPIRSVRARDVARAAC